MAQLLDINGTLFGTTSGGGSNFDGTVYSITTGGAEKVLYTFGSKANDGELPLGGLIDVNGALFGVTDESTNATTDCGAIYKVTAAGVESVKYLFKNHPDGCGPMGQLVKLNTEMYGTTSAGGDSRGDGVIYQATTGGTEKVDYTFTGQPDGSQPEAGLTNASGTMYGTTSSGGTNNAGTIFSFSPAGGEHIVHSFGSTSDGALPFGGLLDVNGTLYGTTERGGTHTVGTVFSFTPSTGTEKVVYNFGKSSTDAATPSGDLVVLNGVLYGTTRFGGASSDGTIYSVTKAGREAVLHSFPSMPGDGGDPVAGLVNVGGTLVGTTSVGGSASRGMAYTLVP
ncbi:MAG TPA: choice-of-anchor tandem repeat GloVer-containing protein [Candidatus Eremiobacteraceae bacterium]|nr:choice-of-anchor tandem repeat GloVer-containing protein [Candidatus Eremiobacteraceae bacterium]